MIVLTFGYLISSKLDPFIQVRNEDDSTCRSLLERRVAPMLLRSFEALASVSLMGETPKTALHRSFVIPIDLAIEAIIHYFSDNSDP